jgi:hypothetical protein
MASSGPNNPCTLPNHAGHSNSQCFSQNPSLRSNRNSNRGSFQSSLQSSINGNNHQYQQQQPQYQQQHQQQQQQQQQQQNQYQHYQPFMQQHANQLPGFNAAGIAPGTTTYSAATAQPKPSIQDADYYTLDYRAILDFVNNPVNAALIREMMATKLQQQKKTDKDSKMQEEADRLQPMREMLSTIVDRLNPPPAPPIAPAAAPPQPPLQQNQQPAPITSRATTALNAANATNHIVGIANMTLAQLATIRVATLAKNGSSWSAQTLTNLAIHFNIDLPEGQSNTNSAAAISAALTTATDSPIWGV